MFTKFFATLEPGIPVDTVATVETVPTPQPVQPRPALAARTLIGRCWNGSQRDGGRLAHAVPDAEFGFGKALCGARPGRTSNGWSDRVEAAVTCPKCLRKMERE